MSTVKYSHSYIFKDCEGFDLSALDDSTKVNTCKKQREMWGFNFFRHAEPSRFGVRGIWGGGGEVHISWPFALWQLVHVKCISVSSSGDNGTAEIDVLPGSASCKEQIAMVIRTRFSWKNPLGHELANLIHMSILTEVTPSSSEGEKKITTTLTITASGVI